MKTLTTRVEKLEAARNSDGYTLLFSDDPDPADGRLAIRLDWMTRAEAERRVNGPDPERWTGLAAALQHQPAPNGARPEGRRGG